MTKLETVDLEAGLARIRQGERGPLYLVAGDRVLAEPAAIRIGETLAEQVGCAAEIHRRPAEIGPLLADLRTYSLFASAKVVVAVETAVLADAGAASGLVDEALEAGSIEVTEDLQLNERQRRSATRLLQTLRLFQIDPLTGEPAAAIAGLPDTVFHGARQGGSRRRRGKKQIEEARHQLTGLLAAARAAELQGWADTELAELADIARRGLPEGHALVLAESAVAADHPVVETLAAEGRLVAVGQVEAARSGGWQGVELLVDELRRETGVGIEPPAVDELARRTIQRHDARAGGRASSDSTARFAAEYRKLATLAGEGPIESHLVENVVEDRGEEDAWKTLDAIGSGEAEQALHRIHRMLAAAEDPLSTRLSFFALLAGFARQLVVISGLIDSLGVPRRSWPYPAFKTQVAPRLQADLADGARSPVAGLHPYRLYRAFGVAARLPATAVDDLLARVLETELRLKGDSSEPDVALSLFVCDLTSALRGR